MQPKKNWKIGRRELTEKEKETAAIAKEQLGLSDTCLRLLLLRGFDSAEKIRKWVCQSDTVLYDPFLMRDMKKAAERILLAVKERQKIAIYGDYDADGVSATSLLFLYIESLVGRLGKGEKSDRLKLGYYIPKRRSEGYGVSVEAVEKLAAEGVELVVTVDTGISAVTEIAHAAELGLDVVVTDHHECPPQLPVACAVVNPHQPGCEYPFKELAGVGVVFKLVAAMEMMLRGEDADKRAITEEIWRTYADLATLGTIADVMPLVGENRMIVSYGLKRISAAPRPGVKALLEMTNGNTKRGVTSSTVSFMLAPRINAAGRMDDAAKAVELFLLTEEDERAKEGADALALALCEYNKARQTEESRIIEQVYEKVESTHDFAHDHFIVAEGDNWHSGVIGIVASHVTERYHLPTILITYGDSDEPNAGKFEIGKGSGRSVPGVNLVEALAACSDCLVKYGGHELAAGLSVTRGNVAELRRRLNDFVRDLPAETWEDEIVADCELLPNEINMSFAEQLLLMEPYGNGNPVPLFYLENAKIVKSYAIGGGKHLKLQLEKDGFLMSAVKFSAEIESFNLSVGEPVDILFQIDINEYNGTRSVQLIVREMRLHIGFQRKLEAAAARYEEIRNGAEFSAEEHVIPNREDFKRYYLYLRRMTAAGNSRIPERNLLTILCNGDPNMNLVKLRLMADILNEMKLCRIERGLYNLLEIHICEQKKKVALEDSQILRRLLARYRESERSLSE